MKYSKIISLLIPSFIFVFIVISYFHQNKNKSNNPISDKNQFLFHLQNSLNLANLKPVFSQVRNYNNEIEFYLNQEDTNKPVKIILSTQKNPYWQIASIQQAIKVAKIKNKNITLIDLKIDHPYATLKNY